jgi:hypothetical protein
MRSWLWPQWAMIAFLAFAFYKSVELQVDKGFNLEGSVIVFGWFGIQALILWRGGFWK